MAESSHHNTTEPFPKASGDIAQHQFLGEGAQYRVYDMGNDRVRKIPQTQEGSERAIAAWHKGTPEEITDYARMVTGLRNRGAVYVNHLTMRLPESAQFFGNPKFLQDGSIEQDKLTPLGDAMKDASPETAERFILGYVDSIKKSWDYGCFDWVFNFQRNTSVDKKGEIVMSDFGEIGMDRKVMHQIIDSRSWEQAYDVQQLDPDLRGFFKGAARTRLTHDSLDRHWRIALK